MKKKLVLLIEDDPLDIISVRRSLSKLDIEYELFAAFNGKEGLHFLENRLISAQTLPDVILLGLNMPKMDGIEFLAVLREDQRMNSIRVFVMTTSTDERDRKVAKGLGVCGYAIKPLNFTDNNKRADSMEAFVQFYLRKILTEISP